MSQVYAGFHSIKKTEKTARPKFFTGAILLFLNIFYYLLKASSNVVFCKTFLHNIAEKKYTPLRLKFFSDYFGLDRAFFEPKALSSEA